MNASSGQQAWTATQVCVLAATGLASSHLQPFIRVLYNDPKTPERQVNGDRRSRTVVVESRETGDEVVCSRQRERNGKYTAVWTSPTHSGPSGSSCEVFNLHSVVDWVELQLWNRFGNGFDVFLGKASVSLHQLQQQCSNATTNQDKPKASFATGSLWFPLQTSEANGLSSHLSLQVECTFTSNPKVLRIREELQQRRKRNAKKKNKKMSNDQAVNDQQDASESGEAFNDDEPATIADPAFAFTHPFLPVDWSLIASTSIRHLFFHSDVERLANFRELVLYSDLEKELDEDESLQINDDHLATFKACQLSAQYLDHCVENLSQRLQGYSADHRALINTRAQLTRKNKSLKILRKRLQKEHGDLDMLIAAYQRVLEKNGGNKLSESQLKQPNSPVRHDSLPGSSSVSPTASISPKKPVFLKTWEERERERRLEKEISRAQRIEEEKQRIIQRVLERQQHDDYEALMSKLTENRKQTAARRIQAFFRNIKRVLHDQRCAVEHRAVTRVQAEWRRFVRMKEFPYRLETRRQEIEMLQMARSEQEQRQWLAKLEQKLREEATTRAMSPPESIQSLEAVKDVVSPSASPSKQVVDALVATWRKLHRVFVLAHRTKGTDYHALFSEIDLRKDDVLDRAELRLGARSFGVRLDRKITRALITLIRAKCGAPSKPLLVTFEQFMTGFELTSKEPEATDIKPLPATQLEVPIDVSDTEIKIQDTTDDTLISDPLEGHVDQPINEEALVMAVRAFRAAIYESAATFLTAQGKLSSDYRAFRDALTHIFVEFDTDRNGELDMDELVACMATFNFRLNDDNVLLLRELFVGDRESGKVGVAEFISFVLAHSPPSSAEDELGLLGHRIREAIMARVNQVQAETASVEDAVRLVFGEAYTRKEQQSCSIRDFMRVFNRLRLGVTSAQLARVIVRLDRDGDRSISFDELLVWLRLRSTPSPDNEIMATPRRSTSQAALQLAAEKAKTLRLLLEKLAYGGGLALLMPQTPEGKKANLTGLFRQIDRNNSGKINQEELQVFLDSQDLSTIVGEEELTQLCGLSRFPPNPTTFVAQEIMALLDFNANGVVTLEEWLTFAQHENLDACSDPVVIESMRKALMESENNDPERLVLWFSKLPGIMEAATTRRGEPAQVKIRVAEFKTALRAKMGGARSVPMQTIDRVVESLDKDSSGWITTSEFCAWAFPPRDLEELLRLVIKSWQVEYQQSPNGDFTANLYKRFDVDGNGSIAVRELLQGFVSFGVFLTEYEARVLLIAFDLDEDGFWDTSEFQAFLKKLFPMDPHIESPIVSSPAQPITDAPDNPAVQVFPPHEGNDAPDESAYSDDDLLLESGSPNDLASPAYSDEKEVSVQPVEYSEDFDESYM